MTTTCKTCRWWENGGQCVAAFWKVQQTASVTVPESDIQVYIRPSGTTFPANGVYLGALNPVDYQTGPDFGCIHHELKDSDAPK